MTTGVVIGLLFVLMLINGYLLYRVDRLNKGKKTNAVILLYFIISFFYLFIVYSVTTFDHSKTGATDTETVKIENERMQNDLQICDEQLTDKHTELRQCKESCDYSGSPETEDVRPTLW